MIRYIKTFEAIFSTNYLSGMHISAMCHSWNVYKSFVRLVYSIIPFKGNENSFEITNVRVNGHSR